MEKILTEIYNYSQNKINILNEPNLNLNNNNSNTKLEKKKNFKKRKYQK